MAKTKRRKRKTKTAIDVDAVYFMKLVIVLILGSLWLKVGDGQTWQLPLPVGMAAGLMFIRNERLKNDRKIMYGVLLAAMLVGFWTPIGIYYTV